MVARHTLDPRAAVERWLNTLRGKRSDATVDAYWYRLKLFVEWAEEHDSVVEMDDLDGFLLDSYEAHRRGQTSNPNTLKNEVTTLQNFLNYCEKIEIVDEGLSDKLQPPQVPLEAQASTVMLGAESAKALLTHYRKSAKKYGQRGHTLLELLWHTGARVGAIVALDLGDIHQHEQRRYIWFRNRPETDTRLKKGDAGERPVLLSDVVISAVERYISQYRHDVTDEYGRDPLITSVQGRPDSSSIRNWVYAATVPCHHSNCPHERTQEVCEWTQYNHGSKCPSSRSPHQIRTGAITWMRNRGIPAEIVAERVNSSVETIEQHYDKPNPVEEMLQRRAESTQDLDIRESKKYDKNDD